MTRERGSRRRHVASDGSGPDVAATESITRQRWNRIEDVLLAALELPEAERGRFLDEECAGDEALRLEVESLLAAHASSGPADRLADTLGARLLAELTEGGSLEGETVGRYEIGERLGRGGMSIVYRAWDPRLERHVALKFLPGLVSSDAASRQRLLGEAQIAAGLEHPNICTIHEIGETEDGRPFIAMPLYDGETLRARLASGPLDEKEAVRLALDAARGLAKAHDRGVVHRDIKPGNLMITGDGTLKILDFGIAQPEGSTDSWVQTPGTTHYMSPEQVAGASADGRSDLWSLGVVLYEMLAGRRPFEGETREAVRHAVAHEEAVPLSTLLPRIQPDLATLVHHLLQKDPSRRPGSAAAVVEALRDVGRHAGLGNPWRRRAIGAVAAILAALAVAAAGRTILVPSEPPPATETRRIAVLPLANLTDDPQEDPLATAVTAQLIAQLAQVQGLLVISHSAVLRYGDRPVPVREVAEELGVDAVLEGSVFRSENEVRMTATLIDGGTGAHLWGRDYTRDFRDLPSLEKELARDVVHAMEVDLSPQEEAQLGTAPAVSPAAQTAYHRGVFLQRLHEEGSSTDTLLERSIQHLSRAVELEPEWAEAHGELARAYHWLASGPPEPRRLGYFQEAKAAAQRAIQLDETFAGGHAALAFVLHNERDWAGAEREYRRALELAPNDDYYRWGWARFELTAARYDEAAADFRRALVHAPASGLLHSQLAYALACADQYQELQLILDLYAPDDAGVVELLGAIAFRQGDHQRAVAQLERAVELSDSATSALASLAYAYASVGRVQEARALVPELEARGTWIPAIYAALGEGARALELLEQGYDQRIDELLRIRCMGQANFADLTKLDVLAEQPAFQDLLRRIDFPR